MIWNKLDEVDLFETVINWEENKISVTVVIYWDCNGLFGRPRETMHGDSVYFIRYLCILTDVKQIINSYYKYNTNETLN